MATNKPFVSRAEMQARADAREIARLKSANVRLQNDSDKLRKLQRSKRFPVAIRREARAVEAVEPVDPRRRPVVGTRVLPPLTPPQKVGRQMGNAVVRELREMAIEMRALLRKLIDQPKASMDALPDDAQNEIRQLRSKWDAKFASLAKVWSQTMIGSVLEQSNAQLTMGLKEIADYNAIEASMATPRMREILQAAVQMNVGLITRIPERFLGGVETAVMAALTTGSGLNHLVPYLTKKYHGDARWAHLVALDQIRKVSETVNATRLQSLGVEEYVWVATGGERYPRKLHHEKLNGRTFRYDDPPIIDEDTRERGKPGDLINCRCRARPVVNFAKIGRS